MCHPILHTWFYENFSNSHFSPQECCSRSKIILTLMFLRFVLRCKSPRHLESPQGINWQLCFHHKINIRLDVCVHLIQSEQILEQFECRHHWVFWNLDYPKKIAILKFKNKIEKKNHGNDFLWNLLLLAWNGFWPQALSEKVLLLLIMLLC